MRDLLLLLVALVPDVTEFLSPLVVQGLVDQTHYETYDLDGGQRHHNKGQVPDFSPLVVFLHEVLHVDADHYEEGEGDMETQSEENPEASRYTVSLIDTLQICQATLLTVKP